MLEEAEESPGGTIGASAIGKGADVLGRSFFVDFLHCSLPGHQWKCAPKHPQNTRIQVRLRSSQFRSHVVYQSLKRTERTTWFNFSGFSPTFDPNKFHMMQPCAILDAIPPRKKLTDVITYSAAISACEKAHQLLGSQCFGASLNTCFERCGST